ncbi:MAG: S9 family peptidase [Flavobacteriales bacterium]
MKKIFALTIILFTLSISATISQEKNITLEDIWASNEFSEDYVWGQRSMNDGEHYTTMSGGRIMKNAYATGEEVSVLFDASEFKEVRLAVSDYQFSADENQLLLASETEGIYRHSSRSFYYVYDLRSNDLKPLTDFSKGKQRLAEFSPSGERIAFVRENNLFAIQGGKEIQITSDGELNKIINGATDWVYEEEFGFDKGFYWSPNGDRIGFYRMDETDVKQFQMAMYGDLYPDQYTFKYPKAGEQNSDVTIHVYDFNTGKVRKVNTGKGDDIYFPRIKWSMSNDGLCIMKLNRHQNHLEFLLTNLTEKNLGDITTTKIYDEVSDTYIEINDNLTFMDENNCFLWNSSKDGYNHLYLFDLTGKQKAQLTSGNWDVIDYLGVDEKKGMFYYSSSEASPMQQHIYKKGITKRVKEKLSEKGGTNSATFSTGFKYYLITNSNANTPSTFNLFNAKGKKIRTLVDNRALASKLDSYDFQPKEFFTFTNSNGDELNCWQIKPANYDASKKYPVYVNIYGGPGHNTVTDSYDGRNYLWHQLLSQAGYYVISCDPRGTMYRGKEFFHSTYLQLGKNETEDFIDLAKHLKTWKDVDPERVGIQGWSYGGFMASHCITQGADEYAMAIAVAPVTNWKYYDSIYTERFMRTPQENNDGYENNSPINHVEKLKGKYLLIHGSADDNVHYQNTMEMVNALVANNKQFDLFIYPDRNHGIYGGYTRLHLFTMMRDYIFENL